MEVVIFCGGKGTRLSEYTETLPKPLVQIGDKPILHHLMDYYKRAGHGRFILLLGYKAEKIRDYFKGKKYDIVFVDSGEDATKAERLRQAKSQVKGETFLLAYGDDLSDLDLRKVIALHRSSGAIITLSAVPLISPFGIVEFGKDGTVKRFSEKPVLPQYMNGGFYVVERKIFDYLKEGEELEKEVFGKLVKEKKIAAFAHTGFWKSMNTLKDVIELSEINNAGNAPWLK